ncbi:helicase-related protein [Staphylococcus pseudoxylosus]|uniref:DNA helicase n=1 Tax=Staphylococcus pseudoxylosus TaxID=2282419 RepID=A0AAQ0MIP8_9STAP|nr:DEAD/DEAH box helicase [Staphylococcus pseudoxylosus]MCE5003232.1 DEAD/DEAH box helicase [Staphylococcus pseudoxylosus]RMI84978.1 DNA helicase [Staphylococcus pseudoxylosus]
MILYSTQEKVLNEAKPSHFFALGTSSGKSLISIYHYLKHRNNEPLLIVCPPTKKKSNEWDYEIKKVEEHENIEIEYEIIASSMLAKEYQNYKNYFVILDEAHYFMNPTSNRGKAAQKLCKASTNFSMLSATPGENWEKFMNYLIIFDFYKNKTEFLKKHAIYETKHFGGRSIKQIVDFQKTYLLERLWQNISTMKETSYFVDLPQVTERFVEFNKSTLYTKAEKDRVIKVDGEQVILDSPPKLAATLRYLTNQKAKVDYTKELLESTNDNVVIFYQFTKEKNNLLQMINKLDKKIYEVSGQTFELPTQEERLTLTNSVTLVQIQAGSAAIELKYASQVIYYCPTYSYTQYQQSRGRCIRHGGHDRVEIIKFKTKGTIETQVWKALELKQDFDEKLYLLEEVK